MPTSPARSPAEERPYVLLHLTAAERASLDALGALYGCRDRRETLRLLVREGALLAGSPNVRAFLSVLRAHLGRVAAATGPEAHAEALAAMLGWYERAEDALARLPLALDALLAEELPT